MIADILNFDYGHFYFNKINNMTFENAGFQIYEVKIFENHFNLLIYKRLFLKNVYLNIVTVSS